MCIVCSEIILTDVKCTVGVIKQSTYLIITLHLLLNEHGGVTALHDSKLMHFKLSWTHAGREGKYNCVQVTFTKNT